MKARTPLAVSAKAVAAHQKQGDVAPDADGKCPAATTRKGGHSKTTSTTSN